jgi:hypothetical protein
MEGVVPQSNGSVDPDRWLALVVALVRSAEIALLSGPNSDRYQGVKDSGSLLLQHQREPLTAILADATSARRFIANKTMIPKRMINPVAGSGVGGTVLIVIKAPGSDPVPNVTVPRRSCSRGFWVSPIVAVPETEFENRLGGGEKGPKDCNGVPLSKPC